MGILNSYVNEPDVTVLSSKKYRNTADSVPLSGNRNHRDAMSVFQQGTHGLELFDIHIHENIHMLMLVQAVKRVLHMSSMATHVYCEEVRCFGI